MGEDPLSGAYTYMEGEGSLVATEKASHQWLACGGNQKMKSYMVKGKRQYRELMQLLSDEGYCWLPGTVQETAESEPLPVDGSYVIVASDNHTIWWRLPEWDRVPGEGLPIPYEDWHAITRTKWLKAKEDNHEQTA